MLLKDKTDEELMKLYQNGTESAFQILYERHSKRIFGFIRSKFASEQRAQEVFQEVFMKIHKSKKLYNETLPVLPWIFTITRTTVIDELRKSRNLKIEDIDLDEIPAESVTLIQDRPTLSNYLVHLPEGQREAVRLRYFEEKTFDEIAEQLSTSSMNVRQLVSRGLKKLKGLIGEGHEK